VALSGDDTTREKTKTEKEGKKEKECGVTAPHSKKSSIV
jgi:hypothetical protein